MANSVPDNVRLFIQQHITSLEEIELLCMVFSDTTRAWTALELAMKLGSVEESIIRRLHHLMASGVVSRSPEGPKTYYRFATMGSDLEQAVRATVATYRSHRISITNMIYDQHRDPLSSFADSFRLRQKGDR